MKSLCHKIIIFLCYLMIQAAVSSQIQSQCLTGFQGFVSTKWSDAVVILSAKWQRRFGMKAASLRLKACNKFILVIVLWMSIRDILKDHYNDDIMGAIASQITSPAIVNSTVYSGTHQRKHQSSAAQAVVWGIHWWPVISPHKGQETRKMFPCDGVIMLTVSSRLPRASLIAWKQSITMLWLVMTSRTSKRVSFEIDCVI